MYASKLRLSKARRKFSLFAVAAAVSVTVAAAFIVPAHAATIGLALGQVKQTKFDYRACLTVNPKPTIQMGSVGNCVALLQWDLNKEGFPTTIDGIFGPMTKANLIKYQTREHLTVDGIAGPQTWNALADNNVVPGMMAPAAQTNFMACLTVNPKPTVQVGSVGNCVALLQWDLNKEGFPTTIDGIFGPMTKANLIKYQTREHLTVDGIAGPQTWNALADNNVVPVKK